MLLGNGIGIPFYWRYGGLLLPLCARDLAVSWHKNLDNVVVEQVGGFTYIDSDNQVGGNYVGVWGDGTYLYTCSGPNGLGSHSVDALGNITNIDEDFQGTPGSDDYQAVYGDGTYIYVACGNAGLRSYSVDGSGNLTYIDQNDPGGIFVDVWGDGTYIYTASRTSGIHSFSVDGSGNLTHVDQNDPGGDHFGVWGDGTYLYSASRYDGIYSYSIDGFGNLTYVDTDSQSSGTYNKLWGDGTYIYVACGAEGIYTYSADGSGNLTFVSQNDPGDNSQSVWGDGTYLYSAVSTNGINSYLINGAGSLTLISTDSQGSSSYKFIWGDGTYIYAVCGEDGVYSYIHSIVEQVIKDSIGTRTDTIYYGQYLDATSGQINFYRTTGTFDYIDPSDGSLIEDVAIPGTGLYTIPTNGICDIVTSDGSEYPVCERAGTVLHDVKENSVHISVVTPSWSESLYGSDFLNQQGFVTKAESDALSYNWETLVNITSITLNDNTLIPLGQWDYQPLLDSLGDPIIDSEGDPIYVKDNI